MYKGMEVEWYSINFRIDKELIGDIDRIAKSLGVSRSAFLRMSVYEAVKFYMGKEVD